MAKKKSTSKKKGKGGSAHPDKPGWVWDSRKGRYIHVPGTNKPDSNILRVDKKGFPRPIGDTQAGSQSMLNFPRVSSRGYLPEKALESSPLAESLQKPSPQAVAKGQKRGYDWTAVQGGRAKFKGEFGVDALDVKDIQNVNFTSDNPQTLKETGKGLSSAFAAGSNKQGINQIYRAIVSGMPSLKSGEGNSRVDIKKLIQNAFSPDELQYASTLKGRKLRTWVWNHLNARRQDTVLGYLWAGYGHGPSFKLEGRVDWEDVPEMERRRKFIEGKSLRNMDVSQPVQSTHDARVEGAITRAKTESVSAARTATKDPLGMAVAGSKETELLAKFDMLKKRLQGASGSDLHAWMTDKSLSPDQATQKMLKSLGLPGHPREAGTQMMRDLRGVGKEISGLSGPRESVTASASRAPRGIAENKLWDRAYSHPSTKFEPGGGAYQIPAGRPASVEGLQGSSLGARTGQKGVRDFIGDITGVSSREPNPMDNPELDKFMKDLEIKKPGGPKGSARKPSKAKIPKGKGLKSLGKGGILGLALMAAMLMGGSNDG